MFESVGSMWTSMSCPASVNIGNLRREKCSTMLQELGCFFASSPDLSSIHRLKLRSTPSIFIIRVQAITSKLSSLLSPYGTSKVIMCIILQWQHAMTTYMFIFRFSRAHFQLKHTSDDLAYPTLT